MSNDMPDAGEQLRVATALLWELEQERLQFHNELLALGHTAACCAVALNADHTLAQDMLAARYAVLAKRKREARSPLKSRPRPESFDELTRDDLIRLATRLTAWLDAAKVDPANQVWLLIHTFVSHGVESGITITMLSQILEERYHAAKQVAAQYTGPRP